MENVNIGVVIGTLAVLIAIIALAFAIFLRFSPRKNPGELLRYFFITGIPILFLTGIAGLWDAYKSGDWTKYLMPVGILCLAANALIVGCRSRGKGPVPPISNSRPEA